MSCWVITRRLECSDDVIDRVAEVLEVDDIAWSSKAADCKQTGASHNSVSLIGDGPSWVCELRIVRRREFVMAGPQNVQELTTTGTKQIRTWRSARG